MRAGAPPAQTLAPLFDRLVQEGPDEEGGPAALWTLDARQLRDSIRHELAHVLGTRCALSLDEEAALDPAGRSAVDYGLPDVGTLSLESSAGARRLERLIAHAVEAFEPRLELIQVSVRPPDASGAMPVAVLTARLASTPQAQPLSLPLRLDRSGRLMEVGDEFTEG